MIRAEAHLVEAAARGDSAAAVPEKISTSAHSRAPWSKQKQRKKYENEKHHQVHRRHCIAVRVRC